MSYKPLTVLQQMVLDNQLMIGPLTLEQQAYEDALDQFLDTGKITFGDATLDFTHE